MIDSLHVARLPGPMEKPIPSFIGGSQAAEMSEKRFGVAVTDNTHTSTITLPDMQGWHYLERIGSVRVSASNL